MPTTISINYKYYGLLKCVFLYLPNKIVVVVVVEGY